MAALFNPTADDAEWPYQLQPLVQCGVLPQGALPQNHQNLATAVGSAVRQHGPPTPFPTYTTPTNTTSMGNRSRAFPARQILEATLTAMPTGSGGSAPAPARAAAALFAASLAVEHEATKHSTKEVMQAAQRAARQEAAAAADASPQTNGNGSGGGSGSGAAMPGGAGGAGTNGKTPSAADRAVADRVLAAPSDYDAARLLVDVMGEEPGMLRSFLAVMGGKPRRAVADAAAEALRAHRYLGAGGGLACGW